jgi:hypothetical protein
MKKCCNVEQHHTQNLCTSIEGKNAQLSQRFDFAMFKSVDIEARMMSIIVRPSACHCLDMAMNA